MTCTHVPRGPQDAKETKNNYGLQKVGKSYFTQEPLLDRPTKWQELVATRYMSHHGAPESMGGFSNFNLNPCCIAKVKYLTQNTSYVHTRKRMMMDRRHSATSMVHDLCSMGVFYS